MSIGLIALLDDIAALAKVAAASLDDIAGQAVKAGAKAAGVVIDDTAVTPRYVVGFAAARELPIVGQIALGSLRNKIFILLPAALALGYFLPQAVTPLLMIGGAYLCYEGTEKVYEALVPHSAHAHEADLGSVALDPQTIEDEKIASAIKTDFILSAEIMAIALAEIPEGSFLTKALILAVVGIGITAAVYGVVALIVKADDAGVALARNARRVRVRLGEPRDRPRAGARHAGAAQGARHHRHGGDDLGRRRHHRARPGGLRPDRHRPRHPWCCGHRGTCGPRGRRRRGMDCCGGGRRRCRTCDRRGADPAGRFCFRAGVEAGEGSSAATDADGVSAR